jgi:hypothetical protein
MDTPEVEQAVKNVKPGPFKFSLYEILVPMKSLLSYKVDSNIPRASLFPDNTDRASQ